MTQLVEAGHPEANQKVKTLKDFKVRVEAIDQTAQEFNDRLIEDLEREQSLVTTNKDFISDSNKLTFGLRL